MKSTLGWVACLLGLALWSACAWGQVNSYQEQADRVLAKLLTMKGAAAPDGAADWPPQVEVVDVYRDRNLMQEFGEHNAEATYSSSCQPEIFITTGLMRDIIEGSDARLAFVAGHELSHLLLKHVRCEQQPQHTPLVQLEFTREQEFAADLNGMKLALGAGYSEQEGLQAYKRINELSPYCSFEALSTDHPSGADRLARLDSAHAELWRAMSSFGTGMYLLSAEEYAEAGRHFRTVIQQFPDSHEAQANLGYALLMQYADAFRPEDVEALSVGQIAVGGFYSRPETLQAKVRGRDAALWAAAMDSLREADRLAPNQPRVLATLGVGYLIQPTGKDSVRAATLLEQSVKLMQQDNSIPALVRAAILVNLEVAQSGIGSDPSQRMRLLSSAQALLEGSDASRQAIITQGALLYNQAMLLSSSENVEDQRSAFKTLELYCQVVNQASAWWPSAYQRYQQLSQQLRLRSRPREELHSRFSGMARPTVTLQFAGNKTLALGDSQQDVRRNMGNGEVLDELPESHIQRVRYASSGMDLLIGDAVIAIIVNGPNSPPVSLRHSGLGSNPEQLRYGMTMDEVGRIFSEQEAEYNVVGNTSRPYISFPDSGVAFSLTGEGKVDEIVIAQLPRLQ